MCCLELTSPGAKKILKPPSLTKQGLGCSQGFFPKFPTSTAPVVLIREYPWASFVEVINGCERRGPESQNQVPRIIYRILKPSDTYLIVEAQVLPICRVARRFHTHPSLPREKFKPALGIQALGICHIRRLKHSPPQRPRSLWSATRISTSSQPGPIFGACAEICLSGFISLLAPISHQILL